jgi:hypothetical protein
VKTKKVLSLILALVMVLSVASFAGAATPSDVPTDLAPAVSRLVGLGILTGYPDGTFKPDNPITRAEFATVAVRAMGLEKTADLLANVPSKFSDVKVTDWFNKYVNVATNQGILKGYPDGTFKPNNNITQAEALTIVLRLLGYDDNLPGNWPYNYVTQADRLGLLSDDFVSSAAASRGGIATLVNNALNQNIVTFEDGQFKVGATPQTFIQFALKGEISSAVAPLTVTEVAEDATGPYNSIKVDDDDPATPVVTLKVAKNVEILGGTFKDLTNHKVIYTTKNGVVVAIQVLSTAITGEVTASSSVTRVVRIKTSTTTYEDLKFDSAAGTIPTSGTIKAYLYLGSVYYYAAVTADAVGTIEAITDKGVNGVDIVIKPESGSNITASVEAGTVFTLNGASATLADMKVGYSGTYKVTSGVLEFFNAWNQTVTGVVESWTQVAGKYTSITINGVAYSVAKSFTGEVPTGVTATFALNAANQITELISTGDFATTVVGKLDTISAQGSGGTVKYIITLKDGISYDVSTAYNAVTQTFNMFKDLDQISAFTGLLVKDADVKISYSGSQVVRVDVFSPKAVITPTDAKAEPYGDGTNPFKNIIVAATRFTSNGLTKATLDTAASIDKYIVTWDGVTGKAASIDAIEFTHKDVEVTGKGIDADGYYVEIDNGGTTQKIHFASSAVSFYDIIKVGDDVNIAVINLPGYIDDGKIAYIEVAP